MSGRLHLATFRPPPGLANRHVQTLLPRLLPRPGVKRDVELLELPDGDFVELAWAHPAPAREDAPLFLLFHGLEGSFASPYARLLLATAARLGWRPVLMHFRGCGDKPNRLPRAYHSGDTADAYWLIGHLAHRYPRALKVAAGVSLGANMLVKLVAEQGGDGLDLAGAIAIGAPLDLAACADSLHQGFSRLYERHLLASLKAKVARRLRAGELPLPLDRRRLAGLDSLRAYDDAVTAPLHGFDGAADYYRRASAGPLLGELELPTLLLHADDDPFMPAGLFERLPHPSASVRVEIARHGGHVGFIEWRDGGLRSWLSRRVGRQLEDWASPAGQEAWPDRLRVTRSDS
ncbi:hydrolase [Halomonas heilongjiangensis]|uniref:Hydrolase n=1 Tax=Halomonas heilongjiangensis TaxID=1387883 RepID=A0A2N7TR48_9GAMM|nr:hydrolase [Halomonas heilongjiangensis]PMR70666.1 hydrolase [Halomonas heilongjiangensis]PXX88779.1 hydrolase [Halomonas heilongjiangensis]